MLKISTLSANEIASPYNENLLSIKLDFGQNEQEEYADERNNCVIFIIDDTPSMCEFTGKSKKFITKYQYACNFIDSFSRKMMEDDMLGVVKLSADRDPIIHTSKKKDVSKLYKTYPEGIADISFALKNSERLLNKINSDYNKIIVLLTDSNYVDKTNKYELEKLAKEFETKGIRISVVKIDKFGEDNYSSLTMNTHGNYYDISQKKYIERVVYKELWNSSLPVAKNIEIKIKYSENIEFSKNIQGFMQLDNSGNLSLFIPKSFRFNEIIIPYMVNDKKCSPEISINVKYKDAITGTVHKAKIIEKLVIAKEGCKENENIIYRAIYEYRDIAFRKVEKIVLRNLYGDAISDMNIYIRNLEKFQCYSSAGRIIKVLKEEANAQIKEFKRRERKYK